MQKIPRLAWRNMWRNWRRTAIAMVAIVLGVVLLLFMDGLIKGADQTIFGNAVRLYGGNIQVHAPGYRDKAKRLPLIPLAEPETVVQAARRLPEVVSASRRINTAGLVTTGEGSHAVVITAVEPGVEAGFNIVAENIADGRFLLDEDEAAVVLGRGLAELLEIRTGDRVAVAGRSRDGAMRQHTMTVVGVFDLDMPEAERQMAFIPLSQAQSLYKLRDQASEVTINLRQVGSEDRVMAALESELPDYEIDSWMTLRPELRQTLDTKLAFTSFFGLIVVAIACIGILNLMLMAVFERTREMGVLAALGMKGRQITALFLAEGTMIGAVGAVVGCLLGLVVVGVVGRVGIDYSFASGLGEITALMGDRLYPSVTIAQAISRGITVTLIAGLASLYPAWLASRRPPAEVLHHV